jgi:glyoxylase-like metal-dependent hydrolase (beta-lactamase superfamily II)
MDPHDTEDPIVRQLRAAGTPDEQIGVMADLMNRSEIVQGNLPGSLTELGVSPADVTDVVFTHLHYDHIGWASANGRGYFPNATFHAPAADLDYYLARPDEELFMGLVYGAMPAADRLAPVLDRMESWETDRTVLPGIDVRLAPGHTPGSSVVVVSDGDARALLLGDIIHCPLELMDDDFNLLVDQDQKLANQVREAYARELEGSDIPVAASHFPGLRFGRLLPGEGVRRWSFDTP